MLTCLKYSQHVDFNCRHAFHPQIFEEKYTLLSFVFKFLFCRDLTFFCLFLKATETCLSKTSCMVFVIPAKIPQSFQLSEKAIIMA